MKDYYYFLGISTEASLEEIKAAYRKLSHKYHPDKNLEDPYFSQRFSELKEAYDTLIDPELRKIYDQGLEKSQRASRSTLPPVIRHFSSSVQTAEIGEKVIIKWSTEHADVVKLVPFGLVKPFGEKTIEIAEFQSGSFQVLLHAQNTLLRKTVVSALTLYDKNHVGEEKENVEENKKSKKGEGNSVSKNRDLPISSALAWVLLAFLLALFIVLGLF